MSEDGQQTQYSSEEESRRIAEESRESGWEKSLAPQSMTMESVR